RMAEQRGKVVLINFWATWCAPCRIEIPDLIELQSEYGTDKLMVVGISLDHDGPETVRRFADEVGFNYPILLDEGDVAMQFGGVYALPTAVVALAAVRPTARALRGRRGISPSEVPDSRCRRGAARRGTASDRAGRAPR